MDAYPRITQKDIRAALSYAADTLAHEEGLFYMVSETEAKA